MKSSEQITGIYKITSPSGKVYIGSAKNIKNRWYKYDTLHCKGQHRIFNSLKKYGAENHIFEVVEECEFEQLYIRERYYQELYDCIGENGLNCYLVATDEKPKLVSEETKVRMSKVQKGSIKHTEESKRKIGEAHKGIAVPEERKKKISESQKGKKVSEEQRLRLASYNENRFYSEEHRRKIGESSKKYHASENSYKRPYTTKFEQLDLEGNLIKVFNSSKELEEAGFSISGVYACFHKTLKTYKKSKWNILSKKFNTV
jgi:group I intron endonuclease